MCDLMIVSAPQVPWSQSYHLPSRYCKNYTHYQYLYKPGKHFIASGGGFCPGRFCLYTDQSMAMSGMFSQCHMGLIGRLLNRTQIVQQTIGKWNKIHCTSIYKQYSTLPEDETENPTRRKSLRKRVGLNEDDFIQESAQELLDKAQLLEEPQLPEFSSDTDYYETKYKSYEAWKRDQAKHAYRPRMDPKQTSLLLFPGQGAQFVGMGKDLLQYPNVKDMYHVASDILGYDLLKICVNGPKEELDKTVHCQPAILVTSLAAVEKLKAENPNVSGRNLFHWNDIFYTL